MESTSRLFAQVLQQDISNGIRAGRDHLEVLLEAGQVLLNATLDITPLDTGELRASGFVSEASMSGAAAAEAFSKGQGMRLKSKALGSAIRSLG